MSGLTAGVDLWGRGCLRKAPATGPAVTRPESDHGLAVPLFHSLNTES